MGCGSCFGLFYTQDRKKPKSLTSNHVRGSSEEHLIGASLEDIDDAPKNGPKLSAIASVRHYMVSCTENSTINRNDLPVSKNKQPVRESKFPTGLTGIEECRGRAVPVKESRRAIKGKDSNGKKMINEYVWEGHIGRGSYGKVDLYRSKMDGRLYAVKIYTCIYISRLHKIQRLGWGWEREIQIFALPVCKFCSSFSARLLIFHRARLCRVRVTPSQSAMADVLQEVSVMKQLDHPNVVKLFEVIDDPESDNFYMVLEYAEQKAIFEGSGPSGGIGEATAQNFFRDVLAGLAYLHNHRIVHGDIKPENLLISGDNRIKICDFSRSWIFKGDNDELRRSPGTPIFTAPECCSGLPYNGKAADIWALGVTLHCMIAGSFPFIGDSVQSTYEKIVQSPLELPEGLNPDLVCLLEGLLCKDPNNRMSLDAVLKNCWVQKGFCSPSQ